MFFWLKPAFPICFSVLNTIIEKNKEYYHYSGSLTTPNCQEIVNWFVFKNEVPISKAQKEWLINFFKDIENPESPFGFGNNRKTQNLCGREIYYSSL